jgi:hypothetical protein
MPSKSNKKWNFIPSSPSFRLVSFCCSRGKSASSTLKTSKLHPILRKCLGGELSPTSSFVYLPTALQSRSARPIPIIDCRTGQQLINLFDSEPHPDLTTRKRKQKKKKKKKVQVAEVNANEGNNDEDGEISSSTSEVSLNGERRHLHHRLKRVESVRTRIFNEHKKRLR